MKGYRQFCYAVLLLTALVGLGLDYALMVLLGTVCSLKIFGADEAPRCAECDRDRLAFPLTESEASP